MSDAEPPRTSWRALGPDNPETVQHVLCLPRWSTAENPLTLYRLDHTGTVIDHVSASLSALVEHSTLARARALTLVLAPEDSVHLTLDTGALHARHLRRALPFLVEESLASDLDTMHVATDHSVTISRRPVIAVATGVMDGWLTRLRAHGIRVDAVYATSQLLGTPANQARVLVFPGHWWFDVWGEAAGCIASVNAPLVLERLLRNQPPHTLEYLLCTSAPTDAAEDKQPNTPPASIASPAWLVDLCHEHGITFSSQPIEADPYAWLATQVVRSAPTFDLLQGAYAGAGRQGEWRRWYRLAAATAAVATVIAIANVVIGVTQNRQGTQAHLEAETLYRDLFPQAATQGPLRKRMEAQLAALSVEPEAGFVMRFRQSMAPLQAGSSDADRGVINLTYTADTDKMDLQIVFHSVDEAEQYRAAFTDPRWSAQLQGTEQTPDGVLARMKLSSGPSQ